MKRFFKKLGIALGLISEANDIRKAIKADYENGTLNVNAVLAAIIPNLEDSKAYIGEDADAIIDKVTDLLKTIIELDLPFEEVLRLIRGLK